MKCTFFVNKLLITKRYVYKNYLQHQCIKCPKGSKKKVYLLTDVGYFTSPLTDYYKEEKTNKHLPMFFKVLVQNCNFLS